MMFAAIDLRAVIAASVAGFILAGAWYGILGASWRAANGLPAQTGVAPLRLIVAYLADLVMAAMLYGVIWHVAGGHFTVRGGIISAAFCWLGFVITVLVTDNVFAERKRVLLLIDGVHWLVALVLMGAILGWLGPA